MATITQLCGFELGSTNEAGSVVGAPSIQTTTVRSGTYALRCNPTAAQAYVAFQSRSAGGTLNNNYGGLRFWLRIGSLPAANCIIVQAFRVATSATQQFLQLNTTGTLSVGNNGS